MNRRTWLRRSGAAAAALAIAPADWMDSRAARTPLSVSGLTGDPIRLHSNENPLGPSASAREAMTAAFDAGCQYPSERYSDLIGRIAERESVPEDHVFLGTGSHEILRMAGMAFGIGEGHVVMPDPTFERMGVYAESAGARLDRVPLTFEMETDLDAMAARVTTDTRMVFICNPNNPTGRIVPDRDLRAFMARLPETVTVFIDEAYHEYVDHPDYRSSIGLARDGANVIVSRTFSKVFGLAGMRIGYGIARPDLARSMTKFGVSSPVSVVSLAAAVASYDDSVFQVRSRRENAAGRRVVYDVLGAMGLKYLESQSNFVFFHIGEDVREFAGRMAGEGIRVGRPFPPYLDWCRVSIGTVSEMRAFAEALPRVGVAASAG